MTITQKTALISMGKGLIDLYAKKRNAIVNRQGYTMETPNYMLGISRRAFQSALKVKALEVTWDEACEIFDAIESGVKS